MGEVDSKDVNKQLRTKIRPLLQAAGFTKFTARNSWRRLDETMWIVNFQSYNSYLADGIGCTTFSFGVNLGVFFDFYQRAPDAPPVEWPPEPAAVLRFHALKRLSQPVFNPYGRHPGKDRPDVWFVAEDGSNLDEVIDDARGVIEEHGLPALRLYDDPLYSYCALFDQALQWPWRSPSPQLEVTTPVRIGSPYWLEVIEAFARRIGRDAHADLENGLDSDLLDAVLGPAEPQPER
jgi:hypothetical protein